MSHGITESFQLEKMEVQSWTKHHPAARAEHGTPHPVAPEHQQAQGWIQAQLLLNRQHINLFP